MKKYTLYTLIALMSFSLVGIVWVQGYWIYNGVLVKEAQFDQLVTEALNNVITDLEEDESIDFIHHQLAQTTSKIRIESDSVQPKKQQLKKWIKKNIKNDSIETKSSFSFDFTSDNDKDVEMKISINGDVQTIDFKEKIKKVEDIIQYDSLLISDDENMVFSDRFGHIMVKMINEFKGIEDPIEHLLKKNNIDSIIRSSLEENGIYLPFSYAVLQQDSLIKHFSSKNFSAHTNAYKVNLFKHNILDFPVQLAISFTSKRNYVLKSMWLMLACSFLFTLIILVTFASTIYYMFKQKKLSEIKNDFINNMTHEFKTPISTISLAIDSITHPKIIEDKDQINYYADIIRKENKRMNKQVENVLNTSLAEKNELTLQKQEVNVADFVNRIKERMKLQLDSANANLTTNEIANNLKIKIDETHFQNAICNLIDNAIKYSNTSPEIRFTVHPKANYYEFIVSDKGIGMSNDTQKKVFDKFYREQTGNIHKVKGFGIGLSYVKAIVEAHSGEIKLTSKLNEGTTVRILLPA
ncbi:MAG: sensor histidine kinase [Flavobacteriales bacterium]